MKVVVLYECSGTVRDAFISAGHDAISVDLLPTMKPGPHWQGDVWDFLRRFPAETWDTIICHPECTFLTVSGLHRNKGNPERAAKTEAAILNFAKLLRLPCPRVYVENPVGCISSRIRKPAQIIQPYQFGHDASKKTRYWGGDDTDYKMLVPTMRKNGRMVMDPKIGRVMERWSNQTDTGQNKLGPSEDRWLERSITYAGVAAAKARYWGGASIRSLIWYLEYQMECLASEIGNG
jgi:hypothetical protein